MRTAEGPGSGDARPSAPALINGEADQISEVGPSIIHVAGRRLLSGAIGCDGAANRQFVSTSAPHHYSHFSVSKNSGVYTPE
ncbi:hypothetical protein [Pseudofrankia sp. BMG5.36]|uniref:hypothetical protein n=1 Tax=Pseudofrankia sp. BMG5.36 TaxID=1834512 RepID=UPI0010428388|nr:hypothetical protein [Pseudofrankia sp. BMG5.36]